MRIIILIVCLMIVGLNSTISQHSDTLKTTSPRAIAPSGFNIVSSTNSSRAILRFSVTEDSIKTQYTNLDSAGQVLAKEVCRAIQPKLDSLNDCRRWYMEKSVPPNTQLYIEPKGKNKKK